MDEEQEEKEGEREEEEEEEEEGGGIWSHQIVLLVTLVTIIKGQGIILALLHYMSCPLFIFLHVFTLPHLPSHFPSLIK